MRAGASILLLTLTHSCRDTGAQHRRIDVEEVVDVG